MSITLLRWSGGAGGDTIMKMLLDSNVDLRSQNLYIGLDDNKTSIDFDYVKSFKYDQIAKMSLRDAVNTDVNLLVTQLNELELDDPTAEWILKTHCYFNFHYKVIDIVVDDHMLPFSVTADMIKNHRLYNNHPLLMKINDPKVLYKFNYYNMAVSTSSKKNLSEFQIKLSDILGGWDKVVESLASVNLYINDGCRQYYESWLQSNQALIPSEEYINLVDTQNYDYLNPALIVEEKYCLLALAKKRFCILT